MSHFECAFNSYTKLTLLNRFNDTGLSALNKTRLLRFGYFKQGYPSLNSVMQAKLV